MVETRIKSCVESGKEMVAEKPSVLHYKGASVYKHAQFKPIDTALSQLYGKERQIAKQEHTHSCEKGYRYGNLSGVHIST